MYEDDGTITKALQMVLFRVETLSKAGTPFIQDVTLFSTAMSESTTHYLKRIEFSNVSSFFILSLHN
jgi:hypothetical protein